VKHLYLLLLTLLIQNCTINKSLKEAYNSKQGLINHEFITGQWVERSDFIRLKERDIAPPHPFNVNTVAHLTCFSEEKPLYDNWGTIYAFLEKKKDYYEYISEDEKLTLQFSVIEHDTTMTLKHQFRTNEPQQILLSKVPNARSCDFNVTPEEGITSGIRVAYNYYYFKGQYSVKDILNNSTTEVEISSNNNISGLKDFDIYELHTFGSYLRVELFKKQKKNRFVKRKSQKCKVVPTDYGFDLYAVPKASYIKKLEKLYEFRRK
jgi:hypothetical protein